MFVIIGDILENHKKVFLTIETINVYSYLYGCFAPPGVPANAVVYSAFILGCLLHAEAVEEEGMLISNLKSVILVLVGPQCRGLMSVLRERLFFFIFCCHKFTSLKSRTTNHLAKTEDTTYKLSLFFAHTVASGEEGQI